MRVVILQPLYLPWIGYFGLIEVADVFVFYDDVQFVHRSWQRRNRIKMPNKSWIWLSVPVIRRFGQKINEVKINNKVNWAVKHWQTIRHAYNKAKFFGRYSGSLADIYDHRFEKLVDLNITIIREISNLLHLNDTEFLLSSDLKVKGRKTERLINILDKLGANEYITGPAAKAYIDVTKFRDAEIRLYWYEYKHPVYQQLYGNFVPYLSVIDLLFNTGDHALDYIRRGLEGALILDKGTR